MVDFNENKYNRYLKIKTGHQTARNVFKELDNLRRLISY